jgi:hypothetical protein
VTVYYWILTLTVSQNEPAELVLDHGPAAQCLRLYRHITYIQFRISIEILRRCGIMKEVLHVEAIEHSKSKTVYNLLNPKGHKAVFVCRYITQAHQRHEAGMSHSSLEFSLILDDWSSTDVLDLIAANSRRNK